MPGPIIRRNKLDDLAIAADQEVRRYAQVAQLVEIRVRIAIESVGEKISDVGSAEFAGWQADIMDDEQIDDGAIGARIKVGRGNARRFGTPSVLAYRIAVYVSGSWMDKRCMR